MTNKKIALYLHLVWSTWDKEPWINKDIERKIHRCICNEARKLGCEIIAINGMPDHIHLLIKYPPTLMVSEVVKKAKGVSSRFINQNFSLRACFKWQKSYGAFTVSRWDTDKIKNYIKHQKEHHQKGDLWDPFENLPS